MADVREVAEMVLAMLRAEGTEEISKVEVRENNNNDGGSMELIVKDNNGRIDIGVKGSFTLKNQKNWKHLDATQSREVVEYLRGLDSKYAYLLNNLLANGSARLGANMKGGVKPGLREILKNKGGTRKEVASPVVEKQVENKVPAGKVKFNKDGSIDGRTKAGRDAKKKIQEAKNAGKVFDYAAMAAFADKVEELKNEGLTNEEARIVALQTM